MVSPALNKHVTCRKPWMYDNASFDEYKHEALDKA